VSKKLCPYQSKYIKPVISVADIEDITELLDKKTKEEVEQNGGQFNFNPEQAPFNPVAPFDPVKSLAACKDGFAKSDMITKCKAHYEAKFNTRVSEEEADCAADYSEFGGPGTAEGKSVVKDSIEDLELTCIEMFVGAGDRLVRHG